MKQIPGFTKGMGIGGWLTNYKRFNVLPDKWRWPITVGDMEHFETYITEKDLDNIVSMGMDHVRVGFDQVVLEEAPYVYRMRIFEILRTFVEQCEVRGLNIVLNLHKSIGNYCDIKEDVTLFDSKELQDRFVALWLKLEDYFSDKPNVMFELLNEVRYDNDGWNRLAGRTLAALREKNTSRWIIIGSSQWNSNTTLKDLTLYDDDRVIYTFHFYAPHEFTHQRSVLQEAPLYYNRSMPYPSDDVERYRDYYRVVYNNPNPYPGVERIDKEHLRRSLWGAKAFVDEHPDKILWCGEFGTIRHADITSRENWMNDVISLLKEWDIPYSVWNYLSTPNDGNRFSLMDDDTRKILSPRLLEIIRGNTD